MEILEYIKSEWIVKFIAFLFVVFYFKEYIISPEAQLLAIIALLGMCVPNLR